MSNRITHSGVVERVEGDCVKVRIVQTSACAACKVAAHCNASESKEKIVDVLNVAHAESLRKGDNVVVSASGDVAGNALLLGFGLPFIVLVAVLVAVLLLTDNEGLAAVSALVALIPYYAVLWLFRDRIRRKMAFELETI
jgi:sigma-E factor negative regulatory protein RseC